MNVVVMIGSRRFTSTFDSWYDEISEEDPDVTILRFMTPESENDIQSFGNYLDVITENIDICERLYVVNVDGYQDTVVTEAIKYAENCRVPITYYHNPENPAVFG